MRRMMVVGLLGVFGAVASFGATNEVNFSSFPDESRHDIKDARVMLERFCTENNCKVISAVGFGTNHEWKVGDGKAVFVLDDEVNGQSRGRTWSSTVRYLKYDAEGRLVAAGSWFDTEFVSVRLKYLNEVREKWAKEHGMTLEEAKAGYLEYEEKMVKAARAEQRQQLKALQEELKRVREVKAAEKAKAESK